MSTVTKTLTLLDYFTDTRPTLGLTELQRLCGRDKATVYRHLLALEACGFVEQDPKTRAYRLGHALDRLAGVRRRTVPVTDTVAPIVDLVSQDEPPPLKWSAPMFRKRRTRNGKQAPQARRDCHEVTAG